MQPTLSVRTFWTPSQLLREKRRQEERVLKNSAAFVMKAGRRMIRPRPQNYDPADAKHKGKPPRHGPSKFLRKGILFGYDRNTHTAVAGFAVKNGHQTAYAFEDGDAVTVYNKRAKKRVRTRYTKRPVIGPAVEKSLPKLKGVFGRLVT